MSKKDLVAIIKENPGCVAIVDNDCWWLYKTDPDTLDDNERDAAVLATDDDVKRLGDDGYGSGNTYGGDLLQALAVIVGVKIKSV